MLLYIGIRLFRDLFGGNRERSAGAKALEEKFKAQAAEIRKEQHSKIAAGIPAEAVVRTISVSLRRVEYEFWGERFSFNTVGMFSLAFVVGIIGGAVIAPFCVAFFQLPVYTVAGATLMATFITSVAGALFFTA